MYEEIGGVMQRSYGKLSAALAMYQENLEIIRELTEDDPQNKGLRRDMSIAYEEIAVVQTKLGDTAAARAAYEIVARVRENLVKDDPDDPRAHRDLSVVYSNLPTPGSRCCPSASRRYRPR